MRPATNALPSKPLCLALQRQRQVLRQVFAGSGNRPSRDALGISVKTVELHRACMMKKMRADSVVALIRMMSNYRRALEQYT